MKARNGADLEMAGVFRLGNTTAQLAAIAFACVLILALLVPQMTSAASLAGNVLAPGFHGGLKPTQASSRYYTPSRGTPERQAIMDSARGPISRELGQTVIFVVQTLRTDGNWAYLQAEPKNPDGSALNWYNTPFARDWANDMMSDVIMVLLRRDGGGFIVVDYVIGPTDVYWYGWLDTYSLPEALFYSP